MIGDLIAKVAERSKSGISINECDYKKDGILYCGKCHTPKQGKYTVGGKTIKPLILCKCGQEAYEKEEAEKKAKERELYIERLRHSGIQDEKLLECSFDVDDSPQTSQSQAFRRYVEKWSEITEKNIGLLLFGGVGTGKSFYGGCIANEIISRYTTPVIVTSIPRILNNLFGAEDKNKYISRLASIPLLIIDDLGAERETDYALEQIYSVIDERYKANKPLIVTTNLTFEELKNPSDIRYKRIYDRIIEMCIPFNLSGASRRETKAKEKAQEAKNLLFTE